MKHLEFGTIIGGLILTLAASAGGTVIYDDTVNQTGFVLSCTNNQPVGNQFTVGNSAAPYLTNFSIEYYSPNTSFSGSVQMDVSFYLNNGHPPAHTGEPNTIIYNSGWFAIATPYSLFHVNSAVLNFGTDDLLTTNTGTVTPLSPTFQLPTNFTVVVTFRGLAGSDQVGLNIFNPPVVGSNNGLYWFNNGSTWSLLTNTTTVAFGMELQGSAQATTTTTSAPVIFSIGLTNQIVTLTWSSVAGAIYGLQSNTNLTGTNWNNVLPNPTATSTTTSQTNFTGNLPQQFYRVAWLSGP